MWSIYTPPQFISDTSIYLNNIIADFRMNQKILEAIYNVCKSMKAALGAKFKET